MSLELNKVAAAVLVAGLIAMVAGKVADGLYEGGKSPEKRGYEIAGAEEAASEGGVPAAPVPEVDYATAAKGADAHAGEATAKKCQSCHDFTKGGPNKVGPNLFGIVGASHAHKEDYTYSAAMAGLKGKPWNEEELYKFLANPQKYAPGTKMSFAGIKKPDERASLIAYLKTLR